MRKLSNLFMALSVLCFAVPAFAQGGEAMRIDGNRLVPLNARLAQVDGVFAGQAVQGIAQLAEDLGIVRDLVSRVHQQLSASFQVPSPW